MCGSATLTTVESRMIISWQVAMIARAMDARRPPARWSVMSQRSFEAAVQKRGVSPFRHGIIEAETVPASFMAAPLTARPMRADARRNYERLLAAAEQAF